MAFSRTLLIAPGAGDPNSELYKQVYELLVSLARAEGYSDIDTFIRWPGQFSFHGPSILTVEHAVAVLGERLARYEVTGVQYDILARSFGCCVVLLAAEEFHLCNLNRIILWGAIPHWKVWQLFVEEFEASCKQGLEKGVRFDERLYKSCVPLEVLLPRCRFPVRFANAENDGLLSTGFVDYLKNDICAANQLVYFAAPVPGASHEITASLALEIQQLYRTALFG